MGRHRFFLRYNEGIVASPPNYLALIRHYEACFAAKGDTPQGVDWPDAAGARTRYRVMAEVARDAAGFDVLDLGCGAGHFLDYLRDQYRGPLHYQGLDLSTVFVDCCRQKFPGVTFTCADILQDPQALPPCDYVVMNGVFTEKRSLGQDEMMAFTCRMLERAFGAARKGIAFNLMSKHVDWERDDLFHVPYDDITRFVISRLSRHHVIRADYGLFEYTMYVYR
jgi:SAM-dependent methyltransferase